MTQIWANIGLVLVFILIGGVFAAAEMALVSLRESQVRALGQRGGRGARVAKLAEDPNRFLSAVQVGVTLAGFLSAAFGAATLADELAPVLEGWGMSPGLSSTLALVAITLLIAYVSLVLGELAPKRLALQRAERLSLAVAPAIDVIAKVASPLIWLLSKSGDVVVRLAGGDPDQQRDVMTEEEVRDLVVGTESLDPEERRILSDVFNAGDRQIREVMIPRTEVEFLEAKTPIYKAARLATTNPHSRYPVVEGSHDDVIGFVHVRDLIDPAVSGRSVRIEELVRPIKRLPATKRVLSALSEMRREGHHLAILADEYGGTFGIVTLEDLVEELVGEIRDEYDDPDQVRPIVDGMREVDGLLNLDDFAEETGIALPEGPYETVAGYLASALGRLPEEGDSVALGAHDLVVLELDGRRVARIRVAARPAGDERPDADGSTGMSQGVGPDDRAVDRPAGGAGHSGATAQSEVVHRPVSAAETVSGNR